MSLLTFFRRPIVKQSIQACVIMGAGDVIAQTYVENKPLSKINVKRTINFACVGLFFVGPSLHIWYGTLEKIMSRKQTPYIRALKKVAMDQLIFAPIFTAAIIYVFGKVNGESNDRISKRLKNDYVPIMMNNYKLWPAAQMFNFLLVPISYQVLFAQCIAVIWNTYISMVLNKK